MKSFLAAIFTALLVVGCGYKPSSYYVKKSVGDAVFVTVNTLRSDPENSVVIRDAIKEALMVKFGSRLVKKEDAETSIDIKIESAKFTPIQYDTNGYVVLYRAFIVLDSTVLTKEGLKRISSNGSYDFPIEPNTTLSDAKRFEAIKNGGAKAIDMLVSQISIIGALNEARTHSGKGD